MARSKHIHFGIEVAGKVSSYEGMVRLKQSETNPGDRIKQLVFKTLPDAVDYRLLPMTPADAQLWLPEASIDEADLERVSQAERDQVERAVQDRDALLVVWRDDPQAVIVSI